MWSNESARGNAPWRLTRPYVGLSPTQPFAADGKRMLPPVSVPIAPYASPAATATPEPDDDTPGHTASFHTLRGGSTSGWWSENAPSVSLTLPTITAPASLKRFTTVASSDGTHFASTFVPHVVTTPRVHSKSFSAIGTPCSGPSGSPFARAASSRSALAIASSAVTVTYAR